jgi:hypothetical protein
MPRTRRQAAQAVTFPQHHARTDGQAVLLAPGSLSPRKITVKSARCARVWRWRYAPLLTAIFPGKNSAATGRTRENRGLWNQRRQPGVQHHMRRVSSVLALTVASVSILTGCSSQATYRQTVEGVLVLVGGPPGGSPVALPGTVIARNATGGKFIVATTKNGRFRLSLPLGTYRLTGHSPRLQSTAARRCAWQRETISVTRKRRTPSILVVCTAA